MTGLPPRKTIPLLAALALLAAACSSTGSRNVSDAAAPNVSAGAGEQVPGESQVAAGGTATTRAGAVDAEGKPVAGAPGGGGENVAGSAPRAVAPGKALRGIDSKTIKIGIWYLVSGPACTAIGAQNPGEGQCTSGEQSETDAIINWINKHGGVGGRKLVPIYYHTDLTASPYATQAEGACTYFTQDKQVAMVLSEGQIGRPHLARCLLAAKVPFVEPGWYPYDNLELKDFAGYMYQPTRPRPERWTRALIDGLADQGFFSKDARVGLVRFDQAPYARVTNNVIRPRLAHYGVKLTDEAVLRYAPSFAAYGDMNAEIGSAILSFKTKDVNRVIFFDGIGEIETFWLPQAQSQDFRPVYGFSSMSWPTWQQGFAPQEQLENSIGVGWSPFFDVPSFNDPYGNAASKSCKQALEQGGAAGGSGRNNKCDALFFMKTLFDRTRAFTVEGLRAVAEALGTSYVPSASFSARFGPGRYDGPSSYRYFYWDSEANTFKYKPGPLHPMAS